ncbi:MAG: 50S ribosomal protein L7/L12 [Clostridia bacterium]|nr:50S ribosomal protein L7/L12 [Clostridia bacterium]
MADIAKIIEEIKGMTVLELNSLVKAIEEEFGVSAAAPVAVAGAAVAAEAAPAEEKTEFNIVLKEIGGNKIGVIKVVKEALGLGLVEAKSAVEKMGVLKEAVAKEEADKIIEKLKEAGATAVAE